MHHEPARVAARLAAARAAAERRVVELAAELDGIVGGARDANLDDEHDVEGPTVAFERQRVASLLGEARATLASLEAATGRLGQGAYGRCGRCGDAIAAERLEALPGTTRCVACATAPGPATLAGPSRRAGR